MKLRIYSIITISCLAIIGSLMGIVSSVSANDLLKPKPELKTNIVQATPSKPVQNIERTTLNEVSNSAQAVSKDVKVSSKDDADRDGKTEETAKKKPNGETNLPIPRFVSIKSAEVNTRAGPGNNYPIKWVMIKRDLPVEIVQEFEHWRKIRDISGDEGWVHGAMLSGSRSGIILDKTWNIKAKADSTSKIIATVEKGVVVSLKKCDSEQCEISIGRLSGYIPRAAIWGLYNGETIK
jgi:SH3-like domain-containing protein